MSISFERRLPFDGMCAGAVYVQTEGDRVFITVEDAQAFEPERVVMLTAGEASKLGALLAMASTAARSGESSSGQSMSARVLSCAREFLNGSH